MRLRKKTSNRQRIELTDRMLKKFFKNIFTGTVAGFASTRGLSYTLVYNMVHGRIHSLSAKDYRKIFEEDPPHQLPKRVEGDRFRRMVRLWLFLNDDIAEVDLYKEFYPDKNFKKVDYRIFNGEIGTVELRLERIMENKFISYGFDQSEIEEGIVELDLMDVEERVPYEEIKPVLDYLKETLEINPSHILNQWSARYESGELKTVSNRISDYALKLRNRTKEAISARSRFELEKIREEIYGKSRRFSLYSEVESELEFLKKYAGKSLKRYLGRSISIYKKSKLKKIASWRIQNIKIDYNDFIEHRKISIARLLSILKLYLSRKIIGDKNSVYERIVLTTSSYSREECNFTSMDKAARVLGMSKKAFDLLVSGNRDVFRRIGIYDEQWYLPNFYLKEILKKEGFELIQTKYEFLAKDSKKNSSRS